MALQLLGITLWTGPHSACRGLRRGVSKPAVASDLTTEAEQLFPKAYAPVLCELVAVLGQHLGREGAEAMLREAGRRLAAGRASGGDLRARLDGAAVVLGEL